MKTILLLTSLLGGVAHPQVGHSGSVSAETSLAFARALVVEGEYYRAITEFKRSLFFSGPEDTELRATAILGIGEALRAGFEYQRAGEWLHGQLETLRDVGHAEEGAVLLSRAFLDADAGPRLLQIIDESALPTAVAQYYRPLALANGGHWTQAREEFLRVPPENPFRSMAEIQAELALEGVTASWKSPKVAGWLGVVPGLGYFYSGHRQTGMASLIVNAVFFAATYEAFDSDQDVLGGFLSFFSASWYVSNIYGSVQAARRYNNHLQANMWARFQY